MARWLIQLVALQYKYTPAAAASYLSPSIAIAAGAVIISLCCFAIILSMCSFCDIQRERVGDKASSSDGDDHIPPPGGAGSGVKLQVSNFFTMKAKKSSMSTPLKQTKEEGKVAGGEVEQGKLSPQVWQRAIMMGERCKRPNFSGLILYDEKGNPLPRRFPM